MPEKDASCAARYKHKRHDRPDESEHLNLEPSLFSLSMFVLVNRLKYAPDRRPHRFGIEQPFGEMACEIAGMSLGAKHDGAAVPLSNPFWAGARKCKEPLGQRSVIG